MLTRRAVVASALAARLSHPAAITARALAFTILLVGCDAGGSTGGTTGTTGSGGSPPAPPACSEIPLTAAGTTCGDTCQVVFERRLECPYAAYTPTLELGEHGAVSLTSFLSEQPGAFQGPALISIPQSGTLEAAPLTPSLDYFALALAPDETTWIFDETSAFDAITARHGTEQSPVQGYAGAFLRDAVVDVDETPWLSLMVAGTPDDLLLEGPSWAPVSGHEGVERALALDTSGHLVALFDGPQWTVFHGNGTAESLGPAFPQDDDYASTGVASDGVHTIAAYADQLARKGPNGWVTEELPIPPVVVSSDDCPSQARGVDCHSGTCSQSGDGGIRTQVGLAAGPDGRFYVAWTESKFTTLLTHSYAQDPGICVLNVANDSVSTDLVIAAVDPAAGGNVTPLARVAVGNFLIDRAPTEGNLIKLSADASTVSAVLEGERFVGDAQSFDVVTTLTYVRVKLGP